MPKYSEAIEKLIIEFNKLPGIGGKTSERFVFYLLKQPKQELEKLGLAIEHLKDKIKICQACQNFSENDPCSLCSSKSRDQKTICVVAEPQDVISIEKTGEYNGTADKGEVFAFCKITGSYLAIWPFVSLSLH